MLLLQCTMYVYISNFGVQEEVKVVEEKRNNSHSGRFEAVGQAQLRQGDDLCHFVFVHG